MAYNVADMKSIGKKYDLTSGGLMGKLIAFSVPLALSGILQLLFNATDLAVIGRFSDTGAESLAAVSSNNALINLLINVSIGLSVGANVVLAQAIGSGDKERAVKTLHTSVVLSLVLGFFVGIVGFFCARIFLVWMDTDPTVIDKAELYLKIFFLGSPANIAFNFGSALLRAKGDTRRPLVYLAVSGVMNAGLNLILVIFAKMDVAGVALATIAAQYLSSALVFIALFKEKDGIKLEIKKLRIHRRELFSVIRIGLPSGILSSFFSVANVIIQSSINGFGYKLMAGNSTGSSLEGFVYTSMNAVSNAAVTFSGQNYGAKKFDRIKKTAMYCSLIIVVISLAMGAILLLTGDIFPSLYTDDPEVISYATDRMKIILPVYFICGIVEVLVGSVRGMGWSISPMIPSFLCVCAYRIIWVYTVFRTYRTPAVLYYSYPISWTLNLIMDIALFLIIFRREKKKFLLSSKGETDGSVV
ncbi:MAG: MATE family efflux transporter [Christensenellales bacterium]